MAVNIGGMRHRVNVSRATESRTASGQVTKTWSTVATRWARIEPLSGRQLFEARQVQPEVTHRVEMWYDANVAISTKDAIGFGNRTFEIVEAINEGEMNEKMILLCTERP